MCLCKEAISIIDSPVPFDWADQPFSANGFPRKPVTIVESGILQDALADIATGPIIGAEPTGAERVQSYNSVPLPRMSNIRLHIADAIPWERAYGEVTPEELYDFLLTKRLVMPHEEWCYLIGYRGGQVNVISGDFVFNCTAIYRFKEGNITLHQPAIFSGKMLEVLAAIRTGVGAMDIHRLGSCRKQGQSVPSSGGGPLFTLIEAHPHVRLGGQ